MNGIVLGMAMMILSGGSAAGGEGLASPIVQSVSSSPLAATAAPSDALLHKWMQEQSRSVWRREQFPPQQATRARRFTTTDRIIAVAAGFSLGWIVGGVTGGRLTESSNPDDDTSALKGIMIGAPIGAVAGGILGYRWTR